jgi:3-oxoadipate enol-lactonase
VTEISSFADPPALSSIGLSGVTDIRGFRGPAANRSDLCARGFAGPHLELMLSQQTSTRSHARMRDGATLQYSITGSDAGSRIALVHSLAMDGAFWNPVVARLNGSARFLTYDCRGHGASDKPAGPYTVELFADDLSDLLDAAGWNNAIVAGASMGGSVTLGFAAKYASRTLGLGLFDTTAWYGPNAPSSWEERATKAQKEGLSGLVGFQKTRWFGDAFREQNSDIVDASVATFLNNDVAAYAETCRMLGNFDLRTSLGRISVPTAIAVGEEDYATPPEMANDLHTAIKGSTLTVIKAGRHLTPLEKPDDIAAQLTTLLKRVNR